MSGGSKGERDGIDGGASESSAPQPVSAAGATSTAPIGNAHAPRRQAAPGKRTLTMGLPAVQTRRRTSDPAPSLAGEEEAGSGDGSDASAVQLRNETGAGAPAAVSAQLPPALEAQVKGILLMEVGPRDEKAAEVRRSMFRAVLGAYHRPNRQILLERFGNPAAGDELAQLFLRMPGADQKAVFALLADQTPARTEVKFGSPGGEARIEPGETPSAATPTGNDPDITEQMAGEKLVPVAKLARVSAPKGLRLYDAPHKGATTQSILTFDTLVHVERKTAHGWCYAVVLGDSSEPGPTSGVGFVEGQFLVFDPPDPGAHLHHVKGGEKLKDIAARYYEPQGGFPRGRDAHLYVEAIYEVNKGRNAVYRNSVDLGFWTEVFQPAEAEETLRIWEGVGVRAGHSLWLPSLPVIERMKSAGVITSGSRTREALRAVGRKAGPTEEEGLWKSGFTLGVVEGAYGAVRDLVMGAVELGEMIVELVQAIAEKGIDALIEFGKKVIDGFKKLPQALEAMAKSFADRWTQKDPFDRGEFQGEVIGYIAAQTLILIATFGAGAAAQLGGRFANVIKVIRVLDAAADPFTYARGINKAISVPKEITDRVRKTAGAAEDAVDAGGDRARSTRPDKPALESETTSLDGRTIHNDIRKMSSTARHVIRQLEKRGWVRIDEIAPEDLVDVSKWFGKEIGVLQAPYGKLRVILGSQDGIMFSQVRPNEVFVVHTHPVMRSDKSHFARDLEMAGKHTEAVIDWGGQVTYFSKSGIKNPISPSGTVEPLRGYRAAFMNERGNVAGFAKIDIFETPDGTIIKVQE